MHDVSTESPSTLRLYNDKTHGYITHVGLFIFL